MQEKAKLVAAAIIVREGKVLITRRAQGQSLEGYWEFPGGKVEIGESVQECVVRELAEELKIVATAGDVITESLYQYPGGLINLIAVQTFTEAHDFTLTVHDDFVWLEPRELREINLAPADIAIADEIIRQSAN